MIPHTINMEETVRFIQSILLFHCHICGKIFSIKYCHSDLIMSSDIRFYFPQNMIITKNIDKSRKFSVL